MANQRELNSYYNHTYEEMVDLIVELTDKNVELIDEIVELKSEIERWIDWMILRTMQIR